MGAHLPGEDQRRAAERRRMLGFWAMALGSFMAILDIQIVASSINEIRAGLSASVDEIQWVQTAYLIAEVIAVPLSGYLTRMLSIPGTLVLIGRNSPRNSAGASGLRSYMSMCDGPPGK